jgi:hypothetical protein
MRRLIATIGAIAFAVLAAGCGSQSDESGGGDPGGQPTAIVQHSPSTLTVATSLSTDGPMYIEGALARLVLRDSDGTVVATAMKWPGKRVVFDNLDSGTYVLEPALRPCDGNCGYLDPPTDSCKGSFEIDGDLSVRVKFTVGSPCVVGTAQRS